MKLRLVETRDGSHSLIRDDLDESYHNLNGAMTESLYVFIEKGLAALDAQHLPAINILEIGLGTGLNVLLSALKGPGLGFQKLHLTSLEPFPLPLALTHQLNFARYLPDYPNAQQVLDRIHTSQPDEVVMLCQGVSFTKHHLALEDFQPKSSTFDLVYFDAFAPSAQAEVWVFNNLEKVQSSLRQGGILVTYCAKGQFKRDLKALGFQVEALPGCLGKREMTRARLPIDPAV